MEANRNRKIRVPTDRDIRCNSLAQQCGDRTHKIDTNNYCEASILLSSDDYEQLFEAVLVTENFLSYNGSWDFHKVDDSFEKQYTCEIYFKWNGFLSTYGNITQKLKLPSGVRKIFRFSFEKVINS